MVRVVLLCDPSWQSRAIANALEMEGHALTVIEEAREPRAQFLRRRLRRLGPLAVAGQVLFVVWGRLAARRAEPRRQAILAAAGIDETPRPRERVTRLESANDAAALIARADPQVVVINGTRVLSRALLDAIPVPVLNMHAGITPAYRGVHGGYWALARGDGGRCGVTLHLVDAGVDTGDVIAQAPVTPEPRDNFFTYPALQLAAGMPLLLAAIPAAAAGRLEVRPASGESRLYYHPTLWGYLRTGLARGVW